MVTSCSHKATQKFITVVATRITSTNFAPMVSAVSMLESTKNVALKPQTDGTVIKILAKDGQRVKAGQTILVLDNEQQSAALDSAQSEAKKDQLNAERYEFLYQQGATSAKTRDKYAVQAIQSRDQAKANAASLGYKFVRAPINGLIGNLDKVKLGDYVQKGQTITGIVDDSMLWTMMQIPATQANQVRLGQTVMVASQTTPPLTGQGSVVFISPYYELNGTNKSPNTLMVKAAFPNLTGKLKTGQFVKSQIITGQFTSLAVPVQAVFMEAQQPFVYVVVPLSKALPKIKASSSLPEATKKKLESLPTNTPIVLQRAVTLGQLQNNLYPLKSGLQKGEQVVSSNTALLRNGMAVKIAPAQATKKGSN
ncbi:efflux RND transporter periplasmic adaptor subunit [Cyanobacteria bacterium 150NLHA]|nr:efflux RND transporter periplasmic adaptor subunit [Prochlorococcus sp. P1344]NMP05677.1 efflux RND transporter periplasmic adaptor subunit [Prochlorococcus sp. P1361]NMP12402.1 efflux RND transporter periplasmic adaptor subunit [Prochlorococcus sp.P1363]